MSIEGFLIRVLSVTSVVAASATVALPGHADDGPGSPAQPRLALGVNGNWTGADVANAPATASVTASKQAAEKTALADEYAAFREGRGNQKNLQAMTAAFAARYGADALGDDASAGRSGSGPSGTETAMTTATTTSTSSSRILGLYQYGQKRSYWCGPAAAYMMLKYRGANVSRYTKAPYRLSQDALALGYYLVTTKNGATTWSSGVMGPALNHWRENRATGFYITVNAPTPDKFRHAMIWDVDRSMPLTVDTVEWENSWHYNNHPGTKRIGHWIVGYGYSRDGSVSHFADPSTTVWARANPKFVYSTREFAQRFLQTNGMVW